MHPGHDPAMPQIGSARQQLLIPLRYGIGHSKRRQVSRIGMSARESAVIGRIRIFGGNERRQYANLFAPTERTRVLIVSFCRIRGGIVAPHRVDQLHHVAQLGLRIARTRALIVVFHFGRIRRDIEDRRLGSCRTAIDVGQRA
ncbi:hypothetical protein D3C74_312460 [compost metagenome]